MKNGAMQIDQQVDLQVNGTRVAVTVDVRETLLDRRAGADERSGGSSRCR